MKIKPWVNSSLRNYINHIQVLLKLEQYYFGMRVILTWRFKETGTAVSCVISSSNMRFLRTIFASVVFYFPTNRDITFGRNYFTFHLITIKVFKFSRPLICLCNQPVFYSFQWLNNLHLVHELFATLCWSEADITRYCKFEHSVGSVTGTATVALSLEVRGVDSHTVSFIVRNNLSTA